MKNVFVIVSFFLFVIICGCNKNETLPPEELGIELPIKNGSYWVYEFQHRFPDGTVNEDQIIDTLKVIDVVDIDGFDYAVLQSDMPSSNSFSYYRDSMDYKLDPQNHVIFSPEAGELTFNEHYHISGNGDTIFFAYDQFPVKEQIQTNFGIKESIVRLSFKETTENFGNETLVDTTYFSEIGPIQRSYTFLSGTKYIGTLIEFHLEE